jgi:nucleoside-diphosphate-sugar epimerase
MGKFRIAITGATGFIGSHLFLEILKQHLDSLTDLEVLILGRNSRGVALMDRMICVLKNHGFDYLSPNFEDKETVFKHLASNVKGILIDLRQEGLDLSRADYRLLAAKEIDFFFHIGASTDLRDSASVIKLLSDTNFNGTKRILELVSTLKVKQFCYVGTAYVCGDKEGKIYPDDVSAPVAFRNPYEKSKFNTEKYVRSFCDRNNIRFKIFRPSVVCGRLLEEPKGFTSKFDVFYAWFGFFWRLRDRLARDSLGGLDIRINFNPHSGLNVVPVDYVAKVMYQICIQENQEESFHIVADECAPYSLLLKVLAEMDIHGVKHVEKIPDDFNAQERLYYRTVGKIFTPYLMDEKIHFDLASLNAVLKKANLRCPVSNLENFSIVIDYAIKSNFGDI